VGAGYTISEALVAATKTNAEILDMGNKLGTLEVAKLADIIVIDGKPVENLTDLAKVNLVLRNEDIVIKEGRIFIPRHIPVEDKGWDLQKQE